MRQECVNEPVSWLRLEMYEVGDLPADERATVGKHVQSCLACRSRLQSIQDDVPRLLPLPAPPLRPARQPWWKWSPWAGWLAGGAGALAMASVFLVVQAPAPESPWRAKGAELRWEVLREHEGTITAAPVVFAPNDRFKLLLSCAAPNGIWWDVAVWQDGAVSHPLSSGHGPCGNNLAIPGALELTGHGTVQVCLTASEEGPIDRAEAERAGPSSQRCTALSPALP